MSLLLLLHQAVIREDLEAVQILMQANKGDRPSKQTLKQAKDAWGYTAFELACLLGRNQIANLICHPYQPAILAQLQGSSTPNLYSIQEIEKIFHFTYRPHLFFRSYPEFKRALRSCPYILKWGAFGKENRLLGEVMRDKFSRGAQAQVSIRWIDPILGYGLFCEEDLEEGLYVGEYSGWVRAVNRCFSDTNAYCFHYPTRFWSLWPYLVVDSEAHGNLFRFVNHSDTPNLRPVCLVDRDLLHLSFFANRWIRKGEQLTFNYGDDYWRIREKQELKFTECE